MCWKSFLNAEIVEIDISHKAFYYKIIFVKEVLKKCMRLTNYLTPLVKLKAALWSAAVFLFHPAVNGQVGGLRWSHLITVDIIPI